MANKKAGSVKYVAGDKQYNSTRWLPLILFISAFVVYSNTLNHEYAGDDNMFIKDNSFVQKGLSAFPELVGYGSLKGWNGDNTIYYRPVALINFAIQRSLFGNNPAAGHFFNVLLYALLCVTVYKALRKMLQAYSGYLPFIISLLFTLHPLHTEVVSNIKSADELLCMLFGFMGINYLFIYIENKKRRYSVYSCIAFFLCLMSKESGLTYVAIFPLCLFFFSSMPIKRIASFCLPFFAIAIVSLLIRWSVLDSMHLDKSIGVMENSLLAATNVADRLATAFTILLHSLWLLLFPYNLSWDYSFNQLEVVSFSNWMAILSVIIHISLVVIAVIGLKKKNIFSFAIIFYFVTIFLTSNLVLIIGSSFGERFLFTPSLAFCIAMPFLLANIFAVNLREAPIKNARGMFAVIVVICVLYSFKTTDRNKDWKNDHTLFASGVVTSPNSARTHYMYANELAKQADRTTDSNERTINAALAIAEYRKSLAIYPSFEIVYLKLAELFYSVGEQDSAIIMYKKVLEFQPGNAEALNNYGIILLSKKEYRAALHSFLKLTEIKPGDVKGYKGAGNSYYFLGDNKKAIVFFEKALQLDPGNVNLINNLSNLYLMQGDTAKARGYQLD